MGSNTEYSYSLMVNGAQILTGDKTSVSVVFGNLTGRNFALRPEGSHADWLSYMEKELDMPLPLGSVTVACTPEGEAFLQGEIGGALVQEGK